MKFKHLIDDINTPKTSKITKIPPKPQKIYQNTQISLKLIQYPKT